METTERERRLARWWVLIFVAGVAALMALVLGRLVFLHLLEGPSEDAPNYYASRHLLGLRGRILDRNGVVLAESLPGRVIYIDQKDPKLESPAVDRASLPLDLARLLGLPEERLLDAFNGYHTTALGRRRTTIFVAEVADERILGELERRSSPSVRTNRIAGVNWSERRSVRAHPNGARLAHVLGFINREEAGVYGVEQRFDKELQGRDGLIRTMVDARRRELRGRRLEETPPVHGNDVYLTIDNNIQYIIEQALAEAIRRFQADSGIILVQDVRTGEMLGMATLPSFDPQEYSRVGEERWKNIAISRNYEPGSVMKAVTVAMALQYGVISASETFDVGKAGVWFYGGRPLRDHAYGTLTLRDVLARSSNIATAQIGLRMAEPAPGQGMPHANERLWRAFRAMGFGERTGIELIGEEAGILHPYERWNKLSPTRMPIGQGIAVTAIQLCNAFATFGNGGVRMRPTILKEIRSHEGALIRANAPEALGRPISPEVAARMLGLLQAVTDRAAGGTARRAALRSYTVAGKTGTGQIPVNGRYNNQDYNASFVGVYPATAPRLAILVTIERPKGALHSGGNVAAPTFAAVAEEIGHYLSIPADKPLAEEPAR